MASGHVRQTELYLSGLFKMLTWLLRNTKPQTSLIKVTGNGLGQNNWSQFCANTLKEEVTGQLAKLLQSTALLTPNKEEERTLQS